LNARMVGTSLKYAAIKVNFCQLLLS